MKKESFKRFRTASDRAIARCFDFDKKKSSVVVKSYQIEKLLLEWKKNWTKYKQVDDFLRKKTYSHFNFTARIKSKKMWWKRIKRFICNKVNRGDCKMTEILKKSLIRAITNYKSSAINKSMLTFKAEIGAVSSWKNENFNQFSRFFRGAVCWRQNGVIHK